MLRKLILAGAGRFLRLGDAGLPLAADADAEHDPHK